MGFCLRIARRITVRNIYCAYCLFIYVQFSCCPLRALNWSINWIELNWIEYCMWNSRTMDVYHYYFHMKFDGIFVIFQRAWMNCLRWCCLCLTRLRTSLSTSLTGQRVPTAQSISRCVFVYITLYNCCIDYCLS